MNLKHRRLLLLSLFSLLAVFIAEVVPHTFKAIVFWVLVALSGLCLLLSPFRRRFFALFLAILFATSAFFSSYQVSHRKLAAEQIAEMKATPLSVTVITPTGKHGDAYTAEGRLSFLQEGKPLFLRVNAVSDFPMNAGEVLYGEAKLYISDEDSLNMAKGFYGTVYFEEFTVVDRISDLTITLGKLRAFLTERIRTTLPGQSGELSVALLLGNREGLSPDFTRDMKRIGTTHMLSLSGMHLAILTAGFAFFLKRLRLGKHLRTLFLGCFVIFFMILTGLSSSVMRAGFMFLFSALPFFLREERDSFSSLVAAVALICLFEPYATRDLSLWLSALSTLGILFFFDRIRKDEEHTNTISRRFVRLIGISLATTLAATLATLPLTLFIFGTLPLFSPLANLILSPLIQLALYLSLFVLLLGDFSISTWTVSKICNLIFAISDFLAKPSHIVFSLNNAPLILLAFLLFGALLLYFVFCPKSRFRFRVPLSFCLAFALIIGVTEGAIHLRHRNELQVFSYADEEDGSDALLFRYREQRLLTVFSSFKSVGNAERGALAAVSGELDAVLLPYYTESIIDYTQALLSNYKVYRLYLPAPQSNEETDVYKELVSLATKKRVPTVAFQKDTPFFFGFLTVSALMSGTANNATAHAEFLFGYSRISYFSANALGVEHAPRTMCADLLIFGSYGGTPTRHFVREDFIIGDTRILCAAPYILPFTRADGIVFAPSSAAYLPMKTVAP